MSDPRASRRPVRVGLLGYGRIAAMFHLGLLLRLDGCELAAIADPDSQRRAAATTDAPGTPVFDDLDGILSAVDVDAIVIAVPTDVHADAAVAAFEQGKHVYVEKPLAPTTKEAWPAVAACRDAGTVGAVGYVFRFHPLLRALKAAVERGEIGDVVAMRTSFGAQARDLPPWKRSRSTGGGALLDLASHHVDLARFLFEQDVAEVSASVRTLRTEDDTAFVDLALSGGVHVQAFASASAVQEDVVEVYGTDGKLVLDRFGSRALVRVPPSRTLGRHERIRATVERTRRLRDVVAPPTEPSFAAALEAFLDATCGGRFDGATIEDGYRALQVVEAAETSAGTGRRVSIALDQTG